MPVKSLKRSEGSFDVWIDGWHLEFLGDRQPTWEPGVPPNDAVDETEGVRVDASGSPPQVRVGGWVVTVGDPPTAKRVTPDPNGPIVRYWARNGDA